MKIVFVTSSLSAGGAERVATTLANAWSARGDTVSLVPTFSGGGKPFYTLSSNIELLYLAEKVSGNGRSLLGYIRRLHKLRQLIIERDPDVVVSFLPNVNIFVIIALAFLDIPLLICERTDPSVTPIPKFLSLATRFIYKYADMLVVQTPAVREKVKKIFPGVRRIRSISNPLPQDILSIRAHQINQKPKILLSLGRIDNGKQVDVIVDAFCKLASDFDDWVLHIYGEGPDKIKILLQVELLGLQDRVFLKGNTEEPWRVMADADAFVMTSKYEGFPNALLEAMGVGLPCVSFDCESGPREISADGNYALLVPLNDVDGLVAALRKLFADEQLRHDLGEKARDSVLNRYQLSAVLAQWDALFLDVGALHGNK